MPMVVAQLKADLGADFLAIFSDLDQNRTIKEKADAMADVIASRVDAYIRTATVTTSVQTVVVGTLPAGPVAASGLGAGTGGLS